MSNKHDTRMSTASRRDFFPPSPQQGHTTSILGLVKIRDLASCSASEMLPSGPVSKSMDRSRPSAGRVGKSKTLTWGGRQLNTGPLPPSRESRAGEAEWAEWAGERWAGGKREGERGTEREREKKIVTMVSSASEEAGNRLRARDSGTHPDQTAMVQWFLRCGDGSEWDPEWVWVGSSDLLVH